MPVYNVQDYVIRCLISLINQDIPATEYDIIVINDGSIDNTEEIAKSYGNRIRYFFKENGGTPSALNMGIENMRGEYFAWLSHDDMYYPRKIEREVDELSKLPNKETIMLSNYETIDENYKLIARIHVEDLIADYPKREFSKYFHVLFSTMHCCCLIPKKCFEIVGVFDVNWRVAHDHEFLYRILANFPHKLIPEILLTARDSPNRQGRRAKLRCNVEYSLLLISIMEKLTDDDILLMQPSKELFYLSMKNALSAIGWSIGAEYSDVIYQSLKIDILPALPDQPQEEPVDQNPVSQSPVNQGSVNQDHRHSIFGIVYMSIKQYGLRNTIIRIFKKIFRH